MRIPAFFRRNFDAIAADGALRFYGAALASVHILTFCYWRVRAVDTRLAAGRPAVCWPFFENCADFRLLGAGEIRIYLWIYLGLAVLGVLLFLRRRVAWGWAVLALLTLMAVLVWTQDFRLRLNQHYMVLIVSLIFLLLPNKRRLLQYQIVAFYFWAGLLKLDPEWLSGAALYRKPLGVPESLIPAACAYVVILETIVVFGLFSRRPWIFRAALAQLLLFHATSWSVVGFYYPLLMLALLAIFPLARAYGSEEPAPGLRRLLAGREPASTAAFLSCFCFLQIVPWLMPGDSAITGEGRLFALHMFDARVECEAELVLHRAAGSIDRVPLRLRLPTRIKCDPIVYLNIGRAFCRRGCSPANPCISVDLSLRSRRRTDPELRPVIDLKDLCKGGTRYDLWRPNAWILK